MKNRTAKLVVGLALLAVAAGLMCTGTRALFFLGLGLVLISGLLSLRPHPPVSWLGRLASWLSWAGAIAVFLWLSSSGREPLPLSAACVGVLAVGMTELGYWRASRSRTKHA